MTKITFFIAKLTVISFVISFLVYAGVITVLAQTKNSDNLLIALEPKYPAPNQETTATLTSLRVDLNRSNITWYRKGSLVLQGVGAKSYRFKTGDLGETETISVRVRDINGAEFTFTKEFIVGDVDLLWTADTTIPPEYKGRPLASPRSVIIVTAVPQFFAEGSRIGSKTLIYEWFVNDKKLPDDSGAGKYILRYRATPAEGASYKITVLISSPGKSVVTEKSIFIPTVAPEVILYEEKSLEGPWLAEALSAIAMRPAEKKNFRAIPYFFSKNGANLEYIWTINEKVVNSDKRSYILEFGLVEEKTGLVKIDAEVKNIKNILQKAAARLSINVR